MRIKRSYLTGVGIVVAAIALIAYARRPKPMVVDSVAVTRGPLESTVDADGRTRVRERYVVAAPVAGRVERIALTEGTVVHAGEVILMLRPLPLDSTAVAQARARVEAADAIVRQAETDVRTSLAELEQRRRQATRAERLAEYGALAPRDVEEAQLARVQAEGALKAANERVHAADADGRQARAILASQRQRSNVSIPVRSPASGRVLRVPERSERIVAAGTALVEIGDPRSLEVVVDVLSSDAATIHPGDRVRLAEWAGAVDAQETSRLSGRVREIEPSAFTKVSALGVEEQRVNVIVNLDASPPVIGDGFRVEASIVVWSSASVLSVPRSALLQAKGKSGEWTAFIVRQGKAESRSLRIGHVGGAAAEVLTGVEPGDEVVVFPSDQLRDGARVTTRKT
ncbi:MAG TPA: efflux RND transporter periplasmic adaptor subunit [Gemmatimonadaceae bacterium]|jgi:HlyD family secretion protein|nr:efflux RND transporter periplasmic adaptor subunit [Gemmatimonadaceae bacterium]